jgi:outer membrane immunogenic protein
MRKHSLTVLAAATIGLAVSQASAADLPRKAPVYTPPPPPITWTGCYIGANVGGIFGRGDAHFSDFEIGSNDRSGFTGGGQIGCDYQFAGSGWVIGIRNMFNGTTLGKDRTFVDTFGNTITTNSNGGWFDTLTGRIGYAFAPSWLLYGQGGVAWINQSADLIVTPPGGTPIDFGSFDRTRTGWTAGGGVEWMFARGWSAFLEGNYMDFGDNSHFVFNPALPGPCGAPGGCLFNTHAKAATVLVGVNYRFGWGKAPY